MRLAVTLDLGDLIERLPTHPALGIVDIDRLAVDAHIIEHQPVRQVAVMRNRQDLAAGFLLVRLHPVPQVLGVAAVVVGERDEIFDLAGVVPEHHDPVQVVAVR